jgi:hypothetical protein
MRAMLGVSPESGMDRLYGLRVAGFFAGFFGVVERCFCWGFCELWCAERGFLCGKRGAHLVIVWLELIANVG